MGLRRPISTTKPIMAMSAQAGLIGHRHHHTIACLVSRALEGGRSSHWVDQTAAHCLILAFSRSSSLISNSSSTARHLFPSWIASFCSTYRSMSESWIFDILARSSTVRYPSRSIVGLLRKTSANRASLRRAPVLKGSSFLPRVLHGAVTQVQCAGDSWRHALFAQQKMVSRCVSSCRLADDVARAARTVRSLRCKEGSTHRRLGQEQRSPGKSR